LEHELAYSLYPAGGRISKKNIHGRFGGSEAGYRCARFIAETVAKSVGLKEGLQRTEKPSANR